MTGDTTLRTTTDITTIRTVSEVPGTGAVISTHGTGTPGHTDHGDTAAGTITTAGMTHGITADTGDSTTHGTTRDGTTGMDTTIIHIIADGTEDGTHTIITATSTDTDMDMTTSEVLHTAPILKDKDTRPALTGYSPEAALLLEEVQAYAASAEETPARYPA